MGSALSSSTPQIAVTFLLSASYTFSSFISLMISLIISWIISLIISFISFIFLSTIVTWVWLRFDFDTKNEPKVDVTFW